MQKEEEKKNIYVLKSTENSFDFVMFFDKIVVVVVLLQNVPFQVFNILLFWK